MEAVYSLPRLSQRELSSASHFNGELPVPYLRAMSSSRRNIVAARACLAQEDAFSRLLSRSTFSSPASHLPRHRTRIKSAKKTYGSFDDLLKNTETALLVDFYATWCGPCQFMVPVLNDVGLALKDKVRIVKIDSEKYPNIASRYGVQALPTLVLFQNGQPIDRLEGAMTAPELIRRIEEVLSSVSSAKS